MQIKTIREEPSFELVLTFNELKWIKDLMGPASIKDTKEHYQIDSFHMYNRIKEALAST